MSGPTIYNWPQYSPEYWAMRRGKPSSSEMDRVVTKAKFEPASGQLKYACQLIGELMSLEYGQKDDPVSAAMRRGTEFEPESRRFYEFERDCKVTEIGGCLSECGRFWTSTDGLIGDDGVLELKNPSATVHAEWFIAGKIPDDHKPQCHDALLVTKRKYLDFVSYHPGMPPLIVRLVPDEFTEKLRVEKENFWKLLQDTLGKFK